MSRTSSEIRQAIHATESKKTDQRSHYLTTSPLVPRKQKSGTQPPCPGAPKMHDWAPCKYECCLAVVERPYGNAPSSTHHQQPQPAKVDLLWRFCGWPSLLGGLQKRSAGEHHSTAMIIQAKVLRCRSVT
ncbi:BQ5605_C015g07931 [Microbotryum silenes-dioicae]|uniref:BQ5605_C015g07931 protein n=1 Tax=Microbotryum silenes-dioicae TaxID=796604 RepID=A0A2X0NQW5_9BASI|nr:BQ5605_C015g07931 [Microbotryum silenes-dioicae]